MAATFGFHPEALYEYEEAAKYYLDQASPRVADAFVVAVEKAVSSLVTAPLRCGVVEEPGIRRYVFSKFPYLLYYRWEPAIERVTVYAVMHCSREPGYWRERVQRDQ